jgi:hypothetical protein
MTALTVMVIARAIPPIEAGHLSKLFRPIAVSLAIPAIWIAIQAAPMPFGSLAHPIWSSAKATLAEPLTGSISVDPGATLVALARYLRAAGIIFAATAATIGEGIALL